VLNADTTTRQKKTNTLAVILKDPKAGRLANRKNPKRRKTKMSKLYRCPIWDCDCPYFCHRDKEGEGDYGLCLMQEKEGCSPVNECEAFDGVDEEDFEE
jgi:hypothetical protein